MISVLFLLGLTLWMMMGNLSPYSPASLLEHFPIYSWERVYPRWSLSVVFLYTWCLAVGFHNLWNFVPSRFHKTLGVLTFLCFLFHTQDTKQMNTKYLSEIFILPLPKVVIKNKNNYPITVPTVSDYGSDSRMLPAIQANLSTNDIYENLTFYFTNKTIGDKNYKGEFYLLSTGQENVPKFWSPDRYEFGFLKKGDTLVFNQKYHPGFISSDPDAKVCSYHGYLAINPIKDIKNVKIHYSYLPSILDFKQTWPNCKIF
ncbi:hypothetical protein [Leptospira meyeri]|uniref:hypothetical protein n=1 Tax=Leptospira meyeri TaxID=29508 RepID=UPI001E604FC7|nr:hypothetical protein [Leptospira meyeri]